MSVLGSFFELMPTALYQGLLYSFVALGVTIPFRFLNFSDLSSEGSFPLGGALCAVLLLAGMPFYGTLPFVIFGGMLAGIVVAVIHLRFQIHPLLSSIITVAMLYTVALRILGKPNISILHLRSEPLSTIMLIGIVGTLLALLTFVMSTGFGLRLRAVGFKPNLAESLGARISTHTILALAIANGISALGGALVVYSQGYADVGIGQGILMNGLAGLLVGEFILKPKSVATQLLAPVLGSLVFSQISSLALVLGFEPSDLKFITGVLILVVIGFSKFPLFKARTALVSLAFLGPSFFVTPMAEAATVRTFNFTEVMSPAFSGAQTSIPHYEGGPLIPSFLAGFFWVDYEIAPQLRLMYFQRYALDFAGANTATGMTGRFLDPRFGMRRSQVFNIEGMKTEYDLFVQPGITTSIYPQPGRTFDLGFRTNTRYTIPHSRFTVGSILEVVGTFYSQQNQAVDLSGLLIPFVSYEINPTLSTQHFIVVPFRHLQGDPIGALSWDLTGMPYIQNGIGLNLSKNVFAAALINNYLGGSVPSFKNTWASLWVIVAY